MSEAETWRERTTRLKDIMPVLVTIEPTPDLPMIQNFKKLLDSYSCAIMEPKTFTKMYNDLDRIFEQWDMSNLKYIITLVGRDVDIVGADAISSYAIMGINAALKELENNDG